MIEEVCKKSYGVKDEIKKIKRILEDKDDTLLFYNTNELRAIKCLFGNPYFRNEDFTTSEKGFYLNGFIQNISIPIKIKEKIENENIEIIGEIDEEKIGKLDFIQKIKGEYDSDVKKYEFSYLLNLKKENKKIKRIEIFINLKIGNRYEIFEMNKIGDVE